MIIKQNIQKSGPYLLAIIIIAWVFNSWFTSPVALGGDFNFVNYDHFRMYAQRPYIWDYTLNNGFGQVTLFTLPFFYYIFIANKLTAFIVDPFLLHKVIYLYPLLILATGSIYLLSRTVIQNKWARAAAIVLYLVNPYFIMLTSGGQIGVAFAYGCAPLLIAAFIHTAKKINDKAPFVIRLKWYLICAFITAILVGLDSRLALLTLLAAAVLYGANVLQSQDKSTSIQRYLLFITIVAVVVAGFHAYWLLPSLLVQSVALPQGYASEQSVQFFSFARFAHTLTWTHPNYPENLFGVVKEITGTALIIPILAFWGLKLPRKLTLYFASLALIGAFLAKGTNEPFGNIYLWAFQHIPAFSWFRDPTKFFLPLSVAYAILSGLTIQQIIQNNRPQKQKLALLLGSFFLIAYTWYPTFSHQIKGTLAYRTNPQEFKEIEKILKEDKTFGRVLWIPSREMYGYTDKNHPAVSLQELRTRPYCIQTICLPEQRPDPNKKEFTKADLFAQIDAQTNIFNDPFTEELFKTLAINYVIISPDIDKNIYIYDRKYDQSVKERYQENISRAGWLKPLPIKNTTGYTVNQKGFLLSMGSGLNAEEKKFTMQTPTHYTLTIDKPGLPLHFAQSYNENWIVKQGNKTIYPIATRVGMTEFPTADIKPGKVEIQFSGQKYAYIGWTASIITILFTLAFIITIQIKGRRKNEAAR